MEREKPIKKLTLSRETVANLTPVDLDGVHGGLTPVSAVISLVSVVTAAVCAPVAQIFGANVPSPNGPKGVSVPAGAYTNGGTAVPVTAGGRCCAPQTPILTPRGEVAICDLRAGDFVSSFHCGNLVAVPVIQTCRIRVHDHRVARVTLESGRVLFITATHPTADGRLLGDLGPGSLLGSVRIAALEIVSYTHDATHDILPASSTGTYLAAGALLGSTLAMSIGRSGLGLTSGLGEARAR